MSDRVGKIRSWVNNPLTHNISEKARGYFNELIAEIDRLRANQISGRCGECWCRDSHDVAWCNHWDKEIFMGGFCHEFEPKAVKEGE